MIIRKILLISLYCFVYSMVGQVNLQEDRNVFSVYYTPTLKSDTAYSYQKVGVDFSLPPLAFNRLTFFSTVALEYHGFSYKNEAVNFEEEINKFYSVQFNLVANYKLSKNWSLNAVFLPRVVSGFTKGITKENIDVNGVVFVEKKFNSKHTNRYFKLTAGVGYLTLDGKKTVNPVVNFMGKFNDHVSFVLGIPNTYVKYDFNKNHSIRLLGELNSFTSHVYPVLYLDEGNTKKIENAVFTEASAGIEYNYWLTKSMGVIIRGTHSLFSEYRLEDGNENILYNFNATLKPYVSFGIKFNPFR